jgi:putative glutamine amidotransferase
VEYFAYHGIDIIPVSNCQKVNLNKYFSGKKRLNGIILSGGNSINPREFGQKPLLKNDDYSCIRDKIERKLLDLAVIHKIPVFGICRGMQFINVYFGGKLIQDISGQLGFMNHKGGSKHKISITESRLKKYFQTDNIIVNSYHNQGVIERGVAQDLRYFAVERESGVIEGIYHPDYPIAGVEYHPERDNHRNKYNTLLIKAFIDRVLFWKVKKI